MIGSERVPTINSIELLVMLAAWLLYRQSPTPPKFVKAEYPRGRIIAAAGGQWLPDLSDESAKLLLVEAEIRPVYNEKTRFRRTFEIGSFVFEFFVPSWSVLVEESAKARPNV